MVSELTGNYGLLAPLMLVNVISMIGFRSSTIYEKQVSSRFESPAHFGDFVVDVLEGISVNDLADQGRSPVVIPEDLLLPEILQRIAQAKSAYYPVVDRNMRMTGIFSANDIRRILDEEIPPGLVCAKDIANPRVLTCDPSDTLNQALRKMTTRNFEEIPVVDSADPTKVLFMLSRRSLLTRYTQELERKKGLYAPT